MASGRLRRMNLDPRVKERLIYHNFKTSKDVLSKSPFELVKCLGLGYPSVRDLQLEVSRACAPRCTSALELWRRRSCTPRFLGTSLSQLDEVLHGGLPAGTITEIAGPSGCGKTQFSMMMGVLAAQAPGQGGLGGHVVYIDTESAFSAQRFIEIAENKFPDRYKSDDELTELASKVHVIKESTCVSLLNRLENLEEFLITYGVKFLIIDSIASLIRKEFGCHSGKNRIARTNLLTDQAAILKRLADQFQIPVLVTNQITTRFESTSRPNGDPTNPGESSYATAALGNTWSHCVNTRLIFQYLSSLRRQILVAKSPVAPFTSFVYTIEPSGFVIQEAMGQCYEGTDPGLQEIRVRSSLPQDAFLC